MEAVVITPGRVSQPLAEVPTNTTVLSGDALRSTGSQTVDDALRHVPGFSLFRRSSSLVTHPTTQGVTLRGIGPSGTSRTLVLLDGVPQNDPFGGWVYWSKLPRETIERVEIVRGGGSDAWGNAALGGVIHLVTEAPTERRLRLRASGGSRETWDVEAAAREVRGPFHLELGGSGFDTGGYPVVRSGPRGPIDEDASSEHQAFRGRTGYALSDAVDLSLRGGFFHEERENGTPLAENETDAGDVAATMDVRTADLGDWRLLAYAQLQTFSSTFTSASPDRTTETPALDQFDVPSTGIGASLAWNREIGGGHRLGAGGDFRGVDGETNEDFRFLEGRFQGRRKAGAEQQLFGGFAHDAWSLAPGLVLTLGGRVDFWRSFDAFRRERSLIDGTETRNDRFDDEDEVAFSPKVGLAWRFAEPWSARAAFYRAFRAPTINEQVRPFRVRNDITEANAGLEPEILTGGEAGLDFTATEVFARVTGFWSEIDEPIANVTIGEGPGPVVPCGFVPEGGVCRQRQNLGRTRIRGVEAEAAWSPLPPWRLGVSYLFDDAEVVDAPNGRELEGKRLAQVPRHQV
ncbi:MAG: TonB-dependent receptor plug domain-containing protein, partial [Candidatus Binatia bacterium]